MSSARVRCGATSLVPGVIPSVRLTHIFRQAQQSDVVTTVHRINAGRMPLMQGLEDFDVFPEEDPERVAELIVDIVAHRLPRRFEACRPYVTRVCPFFSD